MQIIDPDFKALNTHMLCLPLHLLVSSLRLVNECMDLWLDLWHEFYVQTWLVKQRFVPSNVGTESSPDQLTSTSP